MQQPWWCMPFHWTHDLYVWTDFPFISTWYRFSYQMIVIEWHFRKFGPHPNSFAWKKNVCFNSKCAAISKWSIYSKGIRTVEWKISSFRWVTQKSDPRLSFSLPNVNVVSVQSNVTVAILFICSSLFGFVAETCALNANVCDKNVEKCGNVLLLLTLLLLLLLLLLLMLLLLCSAKNVRMFWMLMSPFAMHAYSIRSQCFYFDCAKQQQYTHTHTNAEYQCWLKPWWIKCMNDAHASLFYVYFSLVLLCVVYEKGHCVLYIPDLSTEHYIYIMYGQHTDTHTHAHTSRAHQFNIRKQQLPKTATIV